MNSNIKKAFHEGFRDGIPIALGYLAVSFSLGILAKSAGLNPIQGFISSLFNRASAGEYAVYTLIAAGATYIEVVIMTLVCNSRYMLMSTALSQKASPDMPLIHRILVSFGITDEIFAITIKRPGYIEPFYNYGAMAISAIGWPSGTALGIIAGNIMPLRLVSAFSVALYGMFLAVIMPAARNDKIVALTVMLCFIASYLASKLPVISSISSGTRIIILTIVIAAAAAAIFPRPEETVKGKAPL